MIRNKSKEFLIAVIFIFAIFGLAISAFIEYQAVFLDNRWSYNEMMHTIFGIGLTPLV